MKKFQKNEKDIFTIFSAFHKDFPIPSVSYIHPIHAGKAIAEFDLGIEGDDTGDNISSWNKNFSEVTVCDLIQKIWALAFENLYLSPRSVSARHLPPSTLWPTLCIPGKAPCRHWGEGKSLWGR
jgi:hypothetical protein